MRLPPFVPATVTGENEYNIIVKYNGCEMTNVRVIHAIAIKKTQEQPRYMIPLRSIIYSGIVLRVSFDEFSFNQSFYSLLDHFHLWLEVG